MLRAKPAQITAMMVVRNANFMGYPWLEAILSVLPHVDEFLLQEGYSDKDDTLEWMYELVKANQKFRLFRYEWPEGLESGFAIGAATNNLLVKARGDWAWNIQADELWHPHAAQAMAEFLRSGNSTKYDSVSLNFLHLENNCQVVQEGAGYQRAVRIVRTGYGIAAFRDAWTFDPVSSTAAVDMEKPLVHCNYCFWDNVPQKKREQASRLYKDLDHYQIAAEEAEKASVGQIPEEFMETDSPFADRLPDHFLPLLGKLKYEPRMEIVNKMRGV